MSKANSASSNNSATSSEASETQSVEENRESTDGSGIKQSFETASRIPKSWKRMKESASAGSSDKDGESKRPPWRAVSVSTLPKPDKNALLRAKLLDASRRLRAGKVSVGAQTDILPTKLMRDASQSIQTDLVLYKEAGMLTDGLYAKKTEGGEEFVLTYSVSQMTDDISYAEAATQTLLPKLPADDFMEAYLACDLNSQHMNKFSDMERTLLQQICQIRKKNYLGTLESKLSDTMGANKNQNYMSSTMAPTSDFNGRSTLLKPTLASWQFEYGEIDGKFDNSMPYIVQPQRPWCSFVPLLPTVGYGGNFMGAEYNWSLLLLAIDELILESNRLADLIEDITTARRIDYNQMMMSMSGVGVGQNASDFKLEPLTFPAEEWVPIIEEQEKDLAAMMSECEPVKNGQLKENETGLKE